MDNDDNCQFTPNTDQVDSDGDDIGDVCDTNDGNNNDDKPNLTLSGFTVKVGETTYDAFSDTNNVPEFKHGELHTFNITIENDDDGNASSSNYKLLVSEENKYPEIGNKPVYEYRNGNAGSIDGNSEETITFEDYFYDYIASMSLENDKEYFMFIDIDSNDDVDESNETNNDNLKIIRFKYTNTSGKTKGKISLTINNSSNFEVEYNYSSPFNNIKIYNLFGNSIVYESNMLDQNTIINVKSLLMEGIYSIYVNNIYIKKIKIINSGLKPINFD